MVNNLKLSIIVLTHSSDDTLYQCLYSIKNQTFKKFKCIVIGYDTTNACQTIARTICKQDNRFSYISINDKSLCYAKNLGISLACNDYTMFIQDNDFLQQDCFEKAVFFIRKYNPQILWTASIQYTSDNYQSNINTHINGMYHIGDMPFAVAERCYIYDKIYQTSLLKNIRFINTKQEHVSNIMFNHDCLLQTNRVVNINYRLMHHYTAENECIINDESKTQLIQYIDKINDNNVKKSIDLIIKFEYEYKNKYLDYKTNNTSNHLTNSNNLLIAVCAIAKNENLYIREWVEWYKNLGVSKIFLYDNNDIDGEHFEEVINDYIESGFVEIQNWRGIVKSVKSDKDGQTTQGLAYHDCYYSHYKDFDWMCFFDIDEYLEIYYKYNTLNDFFNDFNEYDGICVQWKMYGDNEKLYYENKSIFERFKYEENSSYDKHIKQILKCKEYDTDLLFCAHGIVNKKYNFVNVLKNKPRNVYMDYVEHENLPVYLNHFYSKSTEEFLKRKYNKTSAVTGVNNTRNFNIDFLKKQYFEHNRYTKEKEEFINIFINSNDSVNVYMASLYKDGHVIESIKSIIKQPQVKSLTLSANNYTDKEYKTLISKIKSDKLIIHRTKNEKSSFEKLRFVNNDISTKYVAFCDDDLIFYEGYFIKMINECEKLDAAVSYHGGILKKPLPINHYYIDRKSFSFNKEVKQNKEVDIIGNGVSLFKRDWISYNQWNDLYNNAPEVSMDDITVSYMLRKNGKKLIVIKHYPGDVIERKNNNDTVYNIYKKNDSVQTDWVNKYFKSL